MIEILSEKEIEEYLKNEFSKANFILDSSIRSAETKLEQSKILYDQSIEYSMHLYEEKCQKFDAIKFIYNNK